MEVEGDRQEIQQIQPAAKKTESILINIVCVWWTLTCDYAVKKDFWL